MLLNFQAERVGEWEWVVKFDNGDFKFDILMIFSGAASHGALLNGVDSIKDENGVIFLSQALNLVLRTVSLKLGIFFASKQF